MDDFDLMPGSTKGGPPKRDVFYHYSGPPVVDETIKDPTPTGKYNQPKKNKESDMYVDEEIYDKKINNTQNDSIDIKKIIIISVVVFIIILIIIIAIIIFIVMKNKKNNNNKNKKKIQQN